MHEKAEYFVIFGFKTHLLKLRYLLFFVILYGSQSFGQILYLKIDSKKSVDLKLIDSLGFIKKHLNAKSLFNEINELTNKLHKIGYINYKNIQQNKPNDSTFLFEIELQNQMKFIDIYIGKNTDLENEGFGDLNVGIKRLQFSESTDFLEQLSKRIETKGYSQAKVQLTNIVQKKNVLTADLKVTLGSKRNIKDIVIIGYDKFPIGIKKNIDRQFKKTTFTKANLEKLKNTFDDFNFVSQNKYPEILFMKDTTKVYVYLQKNKANRFDGLIGFGNDENSKVRFNGYLDLLLINTINAGEKFNLNWKSDGNRQTNFNTGIEIPYVLKSRLILKSQLHIFKQDSLFQNTKLFADLGYLLNFNTKLFVGIQTTESTNIQNTSTNIVNFDSQFTTFQFDYLRPNNRESPYYYLFPEQTKINFKAGFGQRKSRLEIENQYNMSLETLHNIAILEKFSLNIRSYSAILNSKTFFTNELFRFGGINSIRGFNENSLQANGFTSALSEFRYAVSPSLYVFALADYGFYDDRTTKNKSTLSGFGTGFGLLTKNGLLQFIYANGQQKSQGNSIVHLNFKVGF